MVKPGAKASELNDRAAFLIAEGGDTPAFLNYTPHGAARAYPAAICISVNDEIVHGIPNETEKVFKEGDIVSIDLGLIHKDMYTEMAVS